MNVRNPRFPLFDSLRAIAALSVFAFHVAFYLGQLRRSALSPYLLQLDVGVTIFFLVSGFLLYRPFVRARRDGEPPPELIPYAARRLARIVPAYWLALPISAALLGLSGVFTAHGIFTYFGFLQVYSGKTLFGSIGQAWTLCVEMTFYAMLPVWAFALRRVRFRSERGFLLSELAPLALLFAAAIAWQLTTLQVNPQHTALVLGPSTAVLPAFLDHFALGMALAVVSVHLAERRRQPGAVRLIGRWPALTWLTAVGAYFVLVNVPGHFDVRGAAIARHELKGLVALAILLPAVFGDPARGIVRRALANRALLWLGLVSYGVYLWHPTVMVLLNRHGVRHAVGAVAWTLLAALITLVIAAASYYGLERYALRLARRVTSRQVPARAAESLSAEAPVAPVTAATQRE